MVFIIPSTNSPYLVEVCPEQWIKEIKVIVKITTRFLADKICLRLSLGNKIWRWWAIF
jgi:hypothetical protein